jgi:hypothetical protein
MKPDGGTLVSLLALLALLPIVFTPGIVTPVLGHYRHFETAIGVVRPELA